MPDGLSVRSGCVLIHESLLGAPGSVTEQILDVNGSNLYEYSTPLTLGCP